MTDESAIDMAALRPVGEFGSLAWCEACASYGVQLLSDGDLPADTAWGFSEIYTHPPERLLSVDRPEAAYYIMVKDGKITGGDGAPAKCRALPGFHVKIQWAAICNQSRSKYGSAGAEQRSADQEVMYAAMEAYVGRPNPLGRGGGPAPVWPPAVRAALRKGAEQGGGLHNIAASLQMPSPEFAGLPTTALGVPAFEKMTGEQKRAFLELCAVEGF